MRMLQTYEQTLQQSRDRRHRKAYGNNAGHGDDNDAATADSGAPIKVRRREWTKRSNGIERSPYEREHAKLAYTGETLPPEPQTADECSDETRYLLERPETIARGVVRAPTYAEQLRRCLLGGGGYDCAFP